MNVTDELSASVVQRMSLSVILFGGLMAVQTVVAGLGYGQLAGALLIAAVTAGVSMLWPLLQEDLAAAGE